MMLETLHRSVRGRRRGERRFFVRGAPDPGRRARGADQGGRALEPRLRRARRISAAQRRLSRADDPRVERRIDIPARQTTTTVPSATRPSPPGAPPARPLRPARRQADARCQAKRIASAASSSVTDRAVARRSRRMPKVIGETRGVWSASQDRVGGASGATGTISPGLERARHVVPAFGLDDDDRGVRATASAIPAASPPPPHGTTMRRWRTSELVDDLDARPCPALPRSRGSSKLGTTVAPVSSADTRSNRFAALGAPIVEDDLRAFGARALDFHRAERRRA